jgi:phosphoribosylamine--glycine ligase
MKLKIRYITKDMIDPDLILRLKKEGHEVLVCVEEETKTLDGSITKLPYEKRLKDLKGTDLIIYDECDFGDEPSDLRKQGYSVIGGSKKSDAMELDRAKGEAIAKLAGIKVPSSQEFTKISDIKEFIKSNPKVWVMKQNGALDGLKGLNFVSKCEDSRDIIDYLEWLEEKWPDGLPQTFTLQEKIEGHEIGAGAYFNGTEFMKDKDGEEFCEICYEHKSLMPGDMSVSTGEMFSLLKYTPAKSNKIFLETLDKMRDILKKVDFRGDVDANCIINETGVYFLEWTMRFGSPTTSGQTAIHKTGWGEFLKACADGQQIPFEYDGRWTIPCFLYAPPFPNSTDDKIRNIIDDKFKSQKKHSVEDLKELMEMRLTTSEDLTVDFKEKLNKQDIDNFHPQYIYYKDGKIKVAIPDGYVAIITGQGDTPKEAGEATAKLLKKILVPKGFYRNDFTSHYDRSKKDLIKWGYLQDDSTIEEQLAEKAKQEEKDKQTKEITEKVRGEYDSKLKEVKDAVRGVIYGK